MAQLAQSPRDRMVQSAALLMRERGVENTSFSQVVAHAKAPRGSIYHYFPGGKSQLIEEATRWAGNFVAVRMIKTLEAGDPVAILDAWPGFWRQVLETSNFAAGCPIAAGTMEGDRTPAVRDAAGEVFRRWQDVFAAGLSERGVEPVRAATLATVVFAGIEGAVILARAERSMEPVERTVVELRRLVEEALAPER
jgi:TetR/AcrR family transcriptional regulator, lmrAB and yxaGH operons repressor